MKSSGKTLYLEKWQLNQKKKVLPFPGKKFPNGSGSMELIFRKKFLRDVRSLGNKELALQLEKIFRQIEKADSLDGIGGLVKLEEYSRYYRIRIKISETRDYRLVLTIRRNKIWVERIALANKIFY